MRTRVRRWIYNHIPMWFRKYNFEVFAALLCMFAGIPLLFGQVDPKSMEASLPPSLVIAWGLILSLGPVGIITGLWGSSISERLEDQIFWRRIEAWGLSALAYATYIYVGVLLVNAPSTAWIASMLILCFGFTCHVREIDIQLRITDVLSEVGIR